MRRFLIATFLTGLVPVLAAAQQLTVDGTNSPYTIKSSTSLTTVNVNASGVLVLDAPLNVSGNLTVASGGTITHDPGVTTAALNVTGTLDVQTGGAIDVSGKGLLGGNRTGNPYGSSGETLSGTLLAKGAPQDAGGSHGGIGSGGTAAYDNQDSPALLGGGGGAGGCGQPGGNGGGFISITAGTLQVDGVLNADGGAAANDGCGPGGGGAGGGLLLSVTNFAGAGGVTARGAGGISRAGGGGGRIHLVYTGTNSFTGTISAAAATGSVGAPYATAGSVEVVDTATNSILVTGGTYLLTAPTSWSAITLGPAGQLSVNGAATVSQAITVPAGATLALLSSDALTNLSVVPSFAGTLVVGAPLSFPMSTSITVQSGGSIVVDAALSVSGNLVVSSGGLITHDSGITTAALNVSGTIDVQPGGAIDVSGKGLLGANQIGNPFPGFGETVVGNGTGVTKGAGNTVGGSHGGVGGGGGLAAYDNQDMPTQLGSGGGSGGCGGLGGNGGGAIVITASTLQVDGNLFANGVFAGNDGCGPGGGGAGGTIAADVGTLTGTGFISASGGGTPSRAGGGGGRIWIGYTAANSFSGTYSAAAAASIASVFPGTAGSVEVVDSSTHALLVAGGYSVLGASTSWASVSLGAAGEVIVNGAGTVTQPITSTAGSIVALNSSDALTNLTVVPQLSGTLIIGAPITWPSSTSLVVQSGGSVVLDSALSVSGNVTVNSGGMITHDQGITTAALNATGTIDVQLGGAIDSSGQGLLGANHVGNPYAGFGETVSGTGSGFAKGAGQRAGGSHGGIGGGGLPAYDNQDAPAQLGSGGGQGSCGGLGGNGGGVIAITAATLQIDGAVRANGAGPGNDGCGQGGAGAGGAISADVGTFAGAGIMSADGAASPNAGGGGGGRIQITCSTADTFGGTVTAAAGTSNNFAAATAGSVEIVNPGTSTSLVVAGASYQAGASTMWSSVNLGAGGALIVNGAATITQPITIGTGATLVLDSSDALTNLTFAPNIAGTLVIGAPITLPASMNLVIQSGGRLVLDAPLSMAGNLTVSSGASITEDPASWTGTLTVGGTLDVQTGGVIDVSGKGLLGANQLGNPESPKGETITGTANAPAPGAGTKVGGTHGGVGGNGGLAPYGNPDAPTLPGSGGGQGACGGWGGNGGGVIGITAGTLQVDGTIRADGSVAGNDGCGQGGGGAGGSINAIVTGTFGGAGLVSASGGGGSSTSGGGGGRIHIAFANSAFSGSLAASGGMATNPGGTGSIELVNTTTNALQFPASGTLTLTASSSWSSVMLGNGATVVISGAATVTQPITVGPGVTAVLASSDALAHLSLVTPIAGTVVVQAPIAFSTLMTITGTLQADAPLSGTSLMLSGTLVSDAPVTLSGNLTVEPGGVVTHDPGNSGFELDVAGTVDVQSGGGIDVSGKGFGGGGISGFGQVGATLNTATLQATMGASTLAGGTFGGLGGTPTGSTTNAEYGDPRNPLMLGSGGGGGTGTCNLQGGSGGGLVVLHAGALQVDGYVRADGTPAATGTCPQGGGGSGGSINVLVETTFSGAGSISASGGASGSGGGGGGRVLITAGTNSYKGTLVAQGGLGTPSGTAGTLSVETSGNQALLVSGGTSAIGASDSYNAVTIQPGGTLDITGAATVTQPIVVATGAQLIVDSQDALSNLSIAPDIGGTVVVNFAAKAPEDLVLSGTLVVNDRFEVRSLSTTGSALVTHSAGVTTMNLIVDEVFDLVLGASVDALGLGLVPGPLAGFGSNGATLDPNTHTVVSGSGAGNGGSHAGLGGGSSVAPIYDFPSAPLFGGGGGGAGTSAAPGGAGGGVIRLSAAAFHVNGFIRASGANSMSGGGGAGGTVVITAGAIDGTTGSILAQGGSSQTGNGGGGGFVVINYASNTFSGPVSASGGTGKSAGANGQGSQAVQAIPPAITSTAPPTAAVGQQYSYAPQASGESPFVWSLVSGPQGAAVDPGTGIFTWTPSSDGAVAATIGVTNAAGSSQQTFTVKVYAKPAITSTGGLTAAVASPYQYNAQNQATATGTPPLTWTAPTAPNGFVIDSSTGDISWTPQTSGAQQICLDVANPAGSDQQCFVVQVSGASGTAPQITSTAAPTGFVGQPYQYDSSGAATATGTAPITWSAGPAPDGFAIDSMSGVIVWTPATSGQFQACIRATNALGSAQQCFTVSVAVASGAVAPHITSMPSLSGIVGLPYAYDAAGAAAATGSTPIAWSTALAPAGLTIDAASGAISWIPQATGAQGVCIVASNPGGQDQQCFEVQVAASANAVAPNITSTAPTMANVGQPYQYTPTAMPAGVMWSTLLAPTGFAIDPMTGAITWTPNTAGSEGICIQATNPYGSANQCFTVQVQTGGTAPTITSTPPLLAAANAPYQYDAAAMGTQPITWSTLIAPTGFGIDSMQGSVTWTPPSPGQYGICIVATNIAGSAQQCFEVQVHGSGSGSAPLITSTPATVGQVGAPYAYDADDIATASGATPILWSVLLAPPGFAIDPTLGTVSWMPTASGPQGICIEATNNYGTADQCFTVQVSAAPVAPQFTSTPPTLATVGQPFTYMLAASGTAPVMFAVKMGPPELSVDASTGVVSWIPAEGGDEEIAFTATNAAGFAVQDFSVTVLPAGNTSAAPVIVHDANPSAAAGAAYQYNDKGAATAGGTAPMTWSLVAGPPGFSIDSSTGIVNWVPVEPGQQVITLQATNSVGQDQYTFSVMVAASAAAPPSAALKVTPTIGDAPLSVTADGSASYSAPGTSLTAFRWDFGDGSPFALGETTNHSYQLPAGYVVRLRVVDDLGDWSEAAVTETVTTKGMQPPTARIVSSQTSGQDSLPVVFSCDCQAGFAPIAAYRWDFGDGTTSTDANVTHTFAAGGWGVTLLVLDQDGLWATDHVFVSVSKGGHAPIEVHAQATPVTGAAPLQVNYTASYRGTAASATWQFADGTTAMGPAPAHTFAQPGIETAVVTVTDSAGVSSSSSVVVVVTDAQGHIPPRIISSPGTMAQAGSAYTYGPAAQGDRPLSWSLGKMVNGTLVGAPAGMTIDATTGALSWTPTNDQAGSVPVSVIATNAAGTDVQDFVVKVTGMAEAPDAGVDAGSVDAGPVDAGSADAGAPAPDAGQQMAPQSKGCGSADTGGAAIWVALGVLALLRIRRSAKGAEPTPGRRA